MNKKAIVMEVFNVLIAVGIIAVVFFIFYAYYGFSERGITAKIDQKAIDLKDCDVLITLLNTPAGNNLTIADLIVTKKSDAILIIESTLRKTYGSLLRYRLTFDGSLVAKTSEEPQSPIVQEAWVPVPYDTPAKIVLEFGI